jgi:hypothetical protein
MADMHSPHAAHADEHLGNPEVQHEDSDVNIAGILAFAVGLIVVAAIVLVAMWLLFRFFDVREARQNTIAYPLAVQQEQRLPPEPRLQTNPRQDLQDFRAAEHDILTTYGWVDKNAGTVRIPIDEAIKLTLQKGLPAREGGAK